MRTPSQYPPNHIRAIREKREMTQEDLADKIGTSNQQVGRLENHQRRLTWDWMQRIATALECHPMDLVESSAASSDERKLLAAYRQLPAQEKRSVTDMADYLAEKSAPGYKPPPKA